MGEPVVLGHIVYMIVVAEAFSKYKLYKLQTSAHIKAHTNTHPCTMWQ